MTNLTGLYVDCDFVSHTWAVKFVALPLFHLATNIKNFEVCAVNCQKAQGPIAKVEPVFKKNLPNDLLIKVRREY